MWMRSAGQYYRNRELVASQLMLWQPTYERKNRGRQWETNIDTLLQDTRLKNVDVVTNCVCVTMMCCKPCQPEGVNDSWRSNRSDLYNYIQYYEILAQELSHIWDTICSDNPKSAYAISSFPSTGYLPARMITGSHVFLTERGYHPRHETLIIRFFVLLLYVPSQQLWSLRDGQFT